MFRPSIPKKNSIHVIFLFKNFMLLQSLNSKREDQRVRERGGAFHLYVNVHHKRACITDGSQPKAPPNDSLPFVMPSLKVRRFEQLRRGPHSNIVEDKKSEQSSWRNASSWRASSAIVSQTGSSYSFSGSSGEIISDTRPAEENEAKGRLLGRRLSSGRCSEIIDASVAVATATDTSRTSVSCLERFSPAWKVNSDAKSRYSKSLDLRYVEGSLRCATRSRHLCSSSVVPWQPAL